MGVMTEVRLEEIAAYYASRKEFDWKDVCGWTYIEHVGTLLAEVRRLRAALEDYGSHSGGCTLDYGDECTCGFRKALEENG